jgi:hypothetical protein
MLPAACGLCQGSPKVLPLAQRCCRSLGLATGLFAGGVPKISAWKIILQGITELRDGWLTRDLEPNIFFHAAHTIIACGKRWKVLASSENILGTLP